MCKDCGDDNHQLVATDFVHLHNHTHYSLLDGLTKVDELVSYVKELGMESVAVTDHGTMSGLVDLYKTAKAQGIRPILGIEPYVAARKMTDKDPMHDKERFHITLLAQNNKGFENLCRLITEAEINGKYYKPRIDHEIMEKYNEGIICLSGCASSEISVCLKNDDYEGAMKLVEWYREVYKDRFYLEMQDHGHPESSTHWDVQNKINTYLQKIAKETGLPLVVTCDGHYLCHDDREAHEVLLCIGTGSNLSDTNRMSLKDFELHVMDPEGIIKRWGEDFPEAILNTNKIAKMCEVDLQLGRILIPEFPVPEGETEKSYIDKLVFRGLVDRFVNQKPENLESLSVDECRKLLSEEVLERIDYELSVVEKMGYNGYFLIVQDFINWGKSQRIVFGPGRGSAAGSLLAYALKITELDPLKYGLLFERFLNPDRISMPDIDTDIQDTRRDEVIEYCSDKYGKDRVSNICTFGKMMAKNAVRDVARVLEVPYAEADRLAKMVPDPVMGRHVKLKDAIRNEPDLKHEYETNPKAKEVIDFASRLEGTIRNHGVHACGVVIAPDELVKFLPLEVSAKGPIATQFPMTEVEELGLLKMDFLGLSNLSVINNALRIIRKVYGADIDISKVPLDDKKTYELFQRAETTGVFQLESAGMKKYLKSLKASSFEDIIAMVALYRPGPMQFIDSFIRRKHGEEKVTYLHPGLENSLKDTYGILIYQEQFMKISKEWCGFTGGQADTLRKAVGKKKIDLMEKVKPEFIEGAIKVGGATKEIAEKFWDQLLEFANYCFNKSHAACYAMIAYWTAYLKAHYPDAFMAALMTSDMRWTDRLAVEIAECNHMGIKVLGPDINQSYADFAVVKGENTIRFGLAAIKNMGKALVEEIVIPERDKNGPFSSICDFSKRVNATKFNKKSWEAAIKAGVFDRFGERSDLLFNLESIQGYGQKVQKDTSSGQLDLFASLGDAGSVPEPEMITAPAKISDKEMLLWERELLGLYLSAHPLDKYDIYFTEQTHGMDLINEKNNDKQVVIGGMIAESRSFTTKSGTKMAFVKIENKTGETEVIVFPNLFEKVGAKLIQDSVIKVSGRVNAKDKDGNWSSEIKIIADNLEVITDEMLENYQETGQKLAEPQRAASRALNGNGGRYSFAKKVVTEKMERPKPVEKPKGADLPRSRQLEQEMAKKITKEKNLNLTKKIKKLFVLIEDVYDTEKLNKAKQICDKYQGESEVILVFKEGEEKRPFVMPFMVDLESKITEELGNLLGDNCVKVQ